jgi:hypothetical protein
MPWRHMGKWKYSSSILNLGTRWRGTVSFTLHPDAGTQSTGGRVGPRAGLNVFEKRKSCSCWGRRYADWAQDREKWPAVFITVMNLRILKNSELLEYVSNCYPRKKYFFPWNELVSVSNIPFIGMWYLEITERSERDYSTCKNHHLH